MRQSGASSHEQTSFKRVFVANRGEIAVRIMRSLREMSKESVAVYSDADKRGMHVRMADYSVSLKGTSLADTYLNIDKMIRAIELSGADAVHPGYGFLSENAEFASRVEALKGVAFIGPAKEAMFALGNKVKARELLQKAGIPIVPGCPNPLGSLEELVEESQRIGFPLVLKAAAGGGGKGMRIVRKSEDLEEAFVAARRESLAFFASEDIFCERYLEEPRHIEFQVLFDAYGAGVHLFERDCSVQRRHQKLLEEAPSVYLDESTRKAMGKVAVEVGKLVGYQGAATVEFICERETEAKVSKSASSKGVVQYYVMEVNTRIQVEHPVTEMITGIDLIKETIRIGEKKPLSFQQEDVVFRGYALEARINAEDPRNGFVPDVGRCDEVHLPAGAFVRVDSHIYPGYTIPDLFDSMLAKVIVWGKDRKDAIARMKRALQELVIGGVYTTKIFHQALLEHPKFVAGDISTTFVDTHLEDFLQFYQKSCSPSPLGEAHSHVLLSVLALRQASFSLAQNLPKEDSLWQKRAQRDAVSVRVKTMNEEDKE